MSSEPPQQPPKPPPAPVEPSPRLFGPVTLGLIAVNVIVFAVAESHGSTQTVETLLRFGAVSRDTVWNGEWWRLLTYMFLHIGAVHLLCNAWFGFRLGISVEAELGPVEYLTLYVLSGVAGGAASVIGHDAVCAGASGAIFGLVGARYAKWRVLEGSWSALLKHPRFRQDAVFIVLWFVLGAYAGFDNYAHAGGLVFGVLFGTALAKGQGAWWPVPACMLLVVGLCFAASRPLPVLHAHAVPRRPVYEAMERSDYPTVITLTDGAQDAALLRLRAGALYMLRRFDDAELVADKLVAKESHEPISYGLRAQMREVRGDLQGAREDLDTAVKLKDDDALVLAMRARVELKLGAADAGFADAAAAAELAPLDTEVQLTLVSATARTGGVQRALDVCEHAIRKLPSASDLELERVELLSELGRNDEALHSADATVQREPKNERAQALRCYVLAAGGQVDLAALACDEAVKLDESADDARIIRGWVALEEGRLDPAAEDFAFALAARKTSGALAGRGFVAFAHEDWKSAAADAQAALALDALDTEALLLSAEVALQGGDTARAKARYAEALKWAPPHWYEGRLASDGLKKLVEP